MACSQLRSTAPTAGLKHTPDCTHWKMKGSSSGQPWSSMIPAASSDTQSQTCMHGKAGSRQRMTAWAAAAALQLPHPQTSKRACTPQQPRCHSVTHASGLECLCAGQHRSGCVLLVCCWRHHPASPRGRCPSLTTPCLELCISPHLICAPAAPRQPDFVKTKDW